MASEDTDIEASHKRPRNNGQTIDVRFLLQSKLSCCLDLSTANGVLFASILSIGIDVESLPEILLDILPKLEEVGAQFENNEQDPSDGHCEVRMLLHQSHAGCIIGKGGSQIKILREKTGAHIKVYSNVCPSSTERVVQISGEVKVIVNCISEIIALISQSPVKGPTTLYDPHNYDSFYSGEYGGYSDGSRLTQRWSPFAPRMSAPLRGSSLRIPPPFMGARGRAPLPPPVRSWTASGRPEGLPTRPPTPASWRTTVRPPAPTEPQYSKPPADSYPFGAIASPSTSSTMGDSIFGTPLPNYAADTAQSAPVTTSSIPAAASSRVILQLGTLFNSKPILNGDKQGSSQVTIPNDVSHHSSLLESAEPAVVSSQLAGAIIGKGGQRIRKIRRESGAGITIDESQPGSNERVITISGTPQQIQMAQYLLQQKLVILLFGPLEKQEVTSFWWWGTPLLPAGSSFVRLTAWFFSLLPATACLVLS
ncbi:HNRNPK [Cordylochernes scorpioides]|uniref:HNRNPK n=1 Tax=Cordylochernes scorpioides TaxID=51811 RepID=A0ABY6KUR9_9ARAC|nr:HNRNPK [Cordylochernes scorpioides]